MKVNSWFDRKKTNNTYISFPIEVNNIKITGDIGSFQNTFPSPLTSDTTVYHGDISFNFQQTE